MRDLLRDMLALLYSIVSRQEEMTGHEDIVATSEELVPRVEEALNKEEDIPHQ